MNVIWQSVFRSYGPLVWLLAVNCASAAEPWNSPYSGSAQDLSVYYDTFSERPKHLDPVSSYVSNEYTIIGQIYEPPLQYHFLKRPYELIPLTARRLPEPTFFDAQGHPLPATAASEEVARSVYRIEIQAGIKYQPHPAFAKDHSSRDPSGQYLYHGSGARAMVDAHTLRDLPETGTRELTAADYVYQIKRLAHPKLHSPVASLLSEHILGLRALATKLSEQLEAAPDGFLDLRDYPLEGARVIDKYSYEISLTGKYPQFIYWLSMPFFAPMPWEAVHFYAQPGLAERNITLNWYPVGTGPFMLVENNPNRRMVLMKNPNFRGEPYPVGGEAKDVDAGLLADAGEMMPFIDAAVYSLEKESIPAWTKFLQGYYDTSGIISDSFDQAVQISAQGDAQLTPEMVDKGIHLSTAVMTTSYYLAFNMRDTVVGGASERARLLRQAISMAVDFEEFISIFLNGRGLTGQGPLPPGIFGYKGGREGLNPITHYWRDGGVHRHDLDKALELMVRAGYPGGRDKVTGRPLVLYYDTGAGGPGTRSRLDWMRKQFSKIGVQLVVRATDFNRFQEKLLKGTAQIYLAGWNADYPDPENFLFLLYGPNAKADNGGENSSNYQSPEFDQLFDTMKSMDNGPARQAIIDEMVEIARFDSPWGWGFHPVAFSLHHAWYMNAKPNLLANNTLKYKRIDPRLRTQKRGAWNPPIIWPLLLGGILLVAMLVPAVLSYRRRLRATAL